MTALALTPVQSAILSQVFADAIDYRWPAACPDCEQEPGGMCPDHAADLDRADAYQALAILLGIEVSDSEPSR